MNAVTPRRRRRRPPTTLHCSFDEDGRANSLRKKPSRNVSLRRLCHFSKRTPNLVLLSLMTLTSLMLLHLYEVAQRQHPMARHTSIDNPLDIQLRVPTSANESQIRFPEQKLDLSPVYYAQLNISLLPATNFRRMINPFDSSIFHEEREELLDAVRHGRSLEHDDEQTRPLACERNNWRSTLYLNCNGFHEITLDRQDDKVTFAGKGYYRYVWLLETEAVREESFVLKQLQLPSSRGDRNHMPNARSFGKIQTEAIIMERLTASPRIVTSYGHCGLDILAEPMPIQVADRIIPNGYGQPKSESDAVFIAQNNLTLEEKLDMAIVMAESIADVHGFDGGAIVHGDVHPDQFLLNLQGQMKLNDFDNAEILDWSYKYQAYCKRDRGTWSGNFRSPEEYAGRPINEQIDTYSMGNMIYVLLTGLWPFYEDGHRYEAIPHKMMQQERPMVPNQLRRQSFIEGKLVEIMERTWAHNPWERPTIFQVVQSLQDVKGMSSEEKRIPIGPF